MIEVSKKDLDALTAIADRWRYDWSEFDGRTLQSQIGGWIEALQTIEDWDQWLLDWGICPKCSAPLWDLECEACGYEKTS